MDYIDLQFDRVVEPAIYNLYLYNILLQMLNSVNVMENPNPINYVEKKNKKQSIGKLSHGSSIYIYIYCNKISVLRKKIVLRKITII